MNRPVRLDKQDNRNNFSLKIWYRIERWMYRYASIILPLLIILGLLLFVVLCYWICGVSATGDTIYNGMDKVI